MSAMHPRLVRHVARRAAHKTGSTVTHRHGHGHQRPASGKRVAIAAAIIATPLVSWWASAHPAPAPPSAPPLPSAVSTTPSAAPVDPASCPQGVCEPGNAADLPAGCYDDTGVLQFSWPCTAWTPADGRRSADGLVSAPDLPEPTDTAPQTPAGGHHHSGHHRLPHPHRLDRLPRL